MPADGVHHPLERRAAAVLTWLRVEQAGALSRAGLRGRRRRGERPVPALVAALADGVVLAETLVALDALPHAAVLRAARRPISVPDGGPGVDAAAARTRFRANTRRTLRALGKIFEHLRGGASLPPGLLLEYAGADVASVPPSDDPAPALALAELVIVAALYGPRSAHFVRGLYALPCRMSADALCGIISSAARFLALLPFEDVVAAANPDGMGPDAHALALGPRKFSLVSDDGRNTPPSRGGRSQQFLPPHPPTVAVNPVAVAHADPFGPKFTGPPDALVGDEQYLSRRLAYNEANARLQEVARTRALVSRLEGSVRGSRAPYRPSGGPPQAPPLDNATGPLPSASRFVPTPEQVNAVSPGQQPPVEMDAFGRPLTKTPPQPYLAPAPESYAKENQFSEGSEVREVAERNMHFGSVQNEMPMPSEIPQPVQKARERPASPAVTPAEIPKGVPDIRAESPVVVQPVIPVVPDIPPAVEEAAPSRPQLSVAAASAASAAGGSTKKASTPGSAGSFVSDDGRGQFEQLRSDQEDERAARALAHADQGSFNDINVSNVTAATAAGSPGVTDDNETLEEVVREYVEGDEETWSGEVSRTVSEKEADAKAPASARAATSLLGTGDVSGVDPVARAFQQHAESARDYHTSPSPTDSLSLLPGMPGAKEAPIEAPIEAPKSAGPTVVQAAPVEPVTASAAIPVSSAAAAPVVPAAAVPSPGSGGPPPRYASAVQGVHISPGSLLPLPPLDLAAQPSGSGSRPDSAGSSRRGSASGNRRGSGASTGSAAPAREAFASPTVTGHPLGFPYGSFSPAPPSPAGSASTPAPVYVPADPAQGSPAYMLHTVPVHSIQVVSPSAPSGAYASPVAPVAAAGGTSGSFTLPRAAVGGQSARSSQGSASAAVAAPGNPSDDDDDDKKSTQSSEHFVDARASFSSRHSSGSEGVTRTPVNAAAAASFGTPRTPRTPVMPTFPGDAGHGPVPATPPTPPSISDVVAGFAVRTQDRPDQARPGHVSTMMPSPRLFQKLISVWQHNADEEDEDEPNAPLASRRVAEINEGSTAQQFVVEDKPSDSSGFTTPSPDIELVPNPVPIAAAASPRGGSPHAGMTIHSASPRSGSPMVGVTMQSASPGPPSPVVGVTVHSSSPRPGTPGTPGTPGSGRNRRLGVRVQGSPVQNWGASPELQPRAGSPSIPVERQVDQVQADSQWRKPERVSESSEWDAAFRPQTETATTTTTRAEPSSSEITTSTASVARRVRSHSRSPTVMTDTQPQRMSQDSLQRLSQESSQSMSPAVHDLASAAVTLDGEDGSNVRVDPTQLDWLTQELLAARDAISRKDLAMTLAERDSTDQKEMLILEKQDAESVVAAMKQILAEREGELREARQRLSVAISGVSKSAKASEPTAAEIELRIQQEAQRKADAMFNERARELQPQLPISPVGGDNSDIMERFDRSDAFTDEVAKRSNAEMTRLWGEVQSSMEEKMMQMINRRDTELAELKIELARRQKTMDELHEARLKLVDENAHIQNEATSAKQERELIITQAAMEISQVQAQLLLVDKFSKKLHDTFTETELLRAQVADSQAKMASFASNAGISAREARELREAVTRAQSEADRWRNVAESASTEKKEAEHRAEEIGRLYKNAANPATARYAGGSFNSGSSAGPSGSGTRAVRNNSPRLMAPGAPEPGPASRAWHAVKAIVTGKEQRVGHRKPPRPGPARRRPPPAGYSQGSNSPAQAPYRSPQYSPRDFAGAPPVRTASDLSNGSQHSGDSAQRSFGSGGVVPAPPSPMSGGPQSPDVDHYVRRPPPGYEPM